MSKTVKNIIALSISSALTISGVLSVSSANAATYQLIDNGEVANQKYTYSQHQNDNGDIAISATDSYNFPIQFEYLDDDDFVSIRVFAANNYLKLHELNNIEDVDALIAGNPTPNDLSWVIKWLENTNTRPSLGKGLDIEYQKVGDTIAMTNISGITQTLNLWDTPFEGTEALTRSTVDIISGMTNSGIVYGTATAPYLPTDTFTDSNENDHVFWLREHGIRGFYSYNQGTQVHQLVPLETQYGGGTSAITDVNDAGIAVGFSSYKLNQTFRDYIENESDGCADSDIVPATMSLEACIGEQQLKYNNSTSDPYHTMAIKATLNPNGNPIIEELGLLVTPHADDERTFSSYALAINSNGTAVGYADGFFDETVTEPSEDQSRGYQYAVVYKSGDVIDLSGDHDNNGTSRAYDINDAGIAVGYITKAIGGKAVKKFFYVNTNVPQEEINMITPDDFFSGSESTAHAINNSNFIVGNGEIETHNEGNNTPRRTAAFVYDMNNDIFTNLNETIPCAIRLTYNIIEANSINDAGIISATAILKASRRDAEGNIMLDRNGNPLTEDVVRAISLEPTPDDSEVCSTEEEEDKVTRQGASISFNGLLFIMGLLALRRKFFS